MCSDCENDQPQCNYCGDSCFALCDDPDTCPCCWCPKHGGYETENGFEMFEECLNGRCRCECHDEIYEDNGWRWEAGVLKTDGKDGLPFKRNGVFPFLKLAGETRERIYGYTFLQDGNRQYSVNHRGTIHTALLHTCRKVYNEARHMPLTINRLCFATPVDNLEFLGFFLAPSVRPLFTGLDIELQYVDWPADACVAALRQLAKMPIAQINEIWLTLENQCDKINAARLGVPKKAISFALPKSLGDEIISLCEDSQRSCDSIDSQYTTTSLDTQHLLQLSM